MKPSSLPFVAIGAALVAVLLMFGIVLTWRGEARPTETVAGAVEEVGAASLPTVTETITSTFEGFPPLETPTAAAPAGAAGDEEFGVTFSGSCSASSGEVTAAGHGFTPKERYLLDVLQPDGSYWPYAAGAKIDGDGTFTWTWSCGGNPPGLWTAVFTDAGSDRKVTAGFTVAAG